MPEFNITAEFIPVNFNLPPVLKEKTITENGYYPAATDNADGYSSVVVDVPNSTESLSVTQNGDYYPSDGNVGFSYVNVNVSLNTADLNVIQNGDYNASEWGYDGWRNVHVELPLIQLGVGSNGTYYARDYGAAGFSQVNVTVADTIFGIQSGMWAGLSVNNGVLSKNTIIVQGYGEFPALTGTLDFYGVTSITGNGVLYNKFIGQSGITGTVDFSTCGFITGNEALRETFQDSGISGLDFSNLRSIRADSVFNTCCYGAVDLTSIDFSNLEEIIGDYVFHFAFVDCGLTSVSFDNLATINGDWVFSETFEGNNRLVSVSFPALNSVTGSNIFSDMLYRCSDVIVHFPAAMQSVLENDPAVANGFGGENITVLFDL